MRGCALGALGALGRWALNLVDVNDVNDVGQYLGLGQTMDLLEILRDALLPFLLPSDMMRFTTTSLQVAQALPLVARRSAAAERPSEGWHLVNYARYAEPKDLDFAWSLLARGSPHQTISDLEFTGMALGAALEAAGRLQHRPDRRRSCLSLVQMLASCNLGWPLGAPAACTYHIQAVTRPLLHIPMVHGDVEAVQLLLNSAADAAACDSAGEPLLCHALRNVLCLGDGAREIFSLLLGSAASVPVALRDAARQHLRSSARYALQRSEPEPTYWWATGGRGLRLCRRLYVEVERAAAGCTPQSPRPGRITRRPVRLRQE